MLISAIETVLQEWSSAISPLEQLELAFPELAMLIEESHPRYGLPSQST